MDLLIVILILLALSELRGVRMPPSMCRVCDRGIHWAKSQWIHTATGDHWAPFPKLDYVMFPDLPYHPATPAREETA